MALVFFKSVDRIIREGGDNIEELEEYGDNGYRFYDRRVDDSMVEEMTRMLSRSLGPYHTAISYCLHQVNKAPEIFQLEEDGQEFYWHDAWVKLFIPDNFCIKKE